MGQIPLFGTRPEPLPAAPALAYVPATAPRPPRAVPRARVDPCGHLEACGGDCLECLELQDEGFCRCSSCPGWAMAGCMYPSEAGPLCSMCHLKAGGEIDGRDELVIWPPGFMPPPGSAAALRRGERAPWEENR